MTRDSVLVRARDLRLCRGRRCVLDLPELAVRRGETLAVVGANGAGKTTLLMLLAHLWRPTEGLLEFDGAAAQGGAAELQVRRRLAMAFQEPLLFSGSVEENVASGLRFRGRTRGECAPAVRDALERFRIAPLARRDACALSGGEAQRVSLARAFAVAPELLLLDEPFSALDPPTREALMVDLEEAIKAGPTTTVLTTHDLGEAVRLADRMLVLERGRIAQLDAPSRVLHRPATASVARFVGMENLLEGRLVSTATGGCVEVGAARFHVGGRPGLPREVLVGIRPEDVRLVRVAPPHAAALPVRIGRIGRRGLLNRFVLEGEFPMSACLPVRESDGWREGDCGFAVVGAEAVHLLPRETPGTPAAVAGEGAVTQSCAIANGASAV